MADSVARWSATWMGRQAALTTDQAAALARNFDLLIGHARTLKPHLPLLRVTNPDVTVLAYVNGMYAKPGAYPDRVYARDVTGARCSWAPFGTDLVAPSAEWADILTGQVRAHHAAGFDGAFLDSMGPGAVVSMGERTAPPADPATGLAYTRKGWLDAVALVVANVRAQTYGSVLALNGIGNGAAYAHRDGGTAALVPWADLAMIEGFVRAASAPADRFPTEAAWQADVDCVAAIEAQGRGALAITKLWVPASGTDASVWRRFATGSYLLGAGPRSRFQFLDARSSLAVYDAGLTVPLGAPVGAYIRTTEGVYARAFTGGLLVVNPGGTSRPFNLGRAYEGGRLYGTLTVASRDAMFLRD